MHKQKAAVSRGIWTIFRGEPRNFANWTAEFGKIFHRKLCALFITIVLSVVYLRVCINL